MMMSMLMMVMPVIMSAAAAAFSPVFMVMLVVVFMSVMVAVSMSVMLVMVLVVVMMLMIMIVDFSALRAGQFRQQFFFQRFCSLHHFQKFFAIQLCDRRRDHRRFCIQTAQDFHTFLHFRRFGFVSPA